MPSILYEVLTGSIEKERNVCFYIRISLLKYKSNRRRDGPYTDILREVVIYWSRREQEWMNNGYNINFRKHMALWLDIVIRSMQNACKSNNSLAFIDVRNAPTTLEMPQMSAINRLLAQGGRHHVDLPRRRQGHEDAQPEGQRPRRARRHRGGSIITHAIYKIKGPSLLRS